MKAKRAKITLEMTEDFQLRVGEDGPLPYRMFLVQEYLKVSAHRLIDIGVPAKNIRNMIFLIMVPVIKWLDHFEKGGK